MVSVLSYVDLAVERDAMEMTAALTEKL